VIGRVRGRLARWALWIAAVVAVPAAFFLALLAMDVLRLPEAVANDDRRFQTSPLRQGGLWEAGFSPGGAGRRLLALDDDVEYRRLVGLYLRVEPGRVDFQGFPELEALRAKAQFELTRKSGTEPDHRRRSRLLTLFGVMTLDQRALTEEEHVNFLRAALEAFRAAIALDPENEDAKTNLETVLRVFGPVELSGQAPSGGRNQGDVSGQGSAGSGY
jgi:hypothetical protein